MHEIDRHTQWLLRESPYVRSEFWNKLEYESLEEYEESIEPYRELFADEVIGRFDLSRCRPTSARARSTRATSGPATKWCSTSSPT